VTLFKSVTISFAGVLAKLAQQQTISNLIVKGFRGKILRVALGKIA
jgi:hypothetical protein